MCSRRSQPGKICGRQVLKKLKRNSLFHKDHSTSNFSKADFRILFPLFLNVSNIVNYSLNIHRQLNAPGQHSAPKIIYIF